MANDKKISAIEQTFQPHTCSNSQGARVFGFYQFHAFWFCNVQKSKIMLFLFSFSSFQTSILLKKQIPVQMSYLYLFWPQSHNIKKTLKPYLSSICMVSDFETFLTYEQGSNIVVGLKQRRQKNAPIFWLCNDLKMSCWFVEVIA